MKTVVVSLLLLVLWTAFVFGYSAFLCAHLDALTTHAQTLSPTPDAVAALEAKFARARPYLSFAVAQEELFAIETLLTRLSVLCTETDATEFSQVCAQLLLCLNELRAQQSLSWENLL